MPPELDIEIQQAEIELKWIRENPDYFRSIGLDVFRKEMEVWQRLGYLYRLRRFRATEHGNAQEE